MESPSRCRATARCVRACMHACVHTPTHPTQTIQIIPLPPLPPLTYHSTRPWHQPIQPPQILEAARAAGAFVPTLCAHPSIPARATCRICLVELETGAGTKKVSWVMAVMGCTRLLLMRSVSIGGRHDTFITGAGGPGPRRPGQGPARRESGAPDQDGAGLHHPGMYD